MIVLVEVAVAVFLVQAPLRTDVICLVVFPCTEAEVVEDRLHSVAVLHLDISLHILGAYPSVADILIPGYKVAVFIELNRSVVFPVPVLKLHAVNMQAVEIFHLLLDVGVLVDGAAVVVELSHEAVTREACPVGRHIDGYRAEYVLLGIFDVIDID